MSKLNPTHHERDDLAWRADRLLLEELSAVEQAEFAELLATDQAAREALADEALLLGTLAQLDAADFAPRPLATPAANHPRRQSPAWAWLASGALAASLLLGAMIVSQRNSFETPSSRQELARHAAEYEQAQALIQLWSESRAAEEALAWETANELREESETADEIAPDWMFAAVRAESGESPAANGEDLQWQ